MVFYNKFFSKNNFLIILLLFFTISVFLFPGFFLKKKLFYDDLAYEFFPRQIAIASSLQKGEIPLWDSHRFMGGCPFYTDYETGTYSILMYPFFIFANLKNFNKAYFDLCLFPFYFFVLLTALGSFYLAKNVLNLNKCSSYIMALIYSLGPHICTDAFLYCSDLIVLGLFPWLILFLDLFIETKRTKWFSAGAITIALISSGGDANYIIRTFFITFLIACYLSLVELKYNKTFTYKIALYAIFLMPIAGICLSAIPWAGMTEGIMWMSDQVNVSPEKIVTKNNSLSFEYLITLFSPDFFGNINCQNAWGHGKVLINEVGSSGLLTSGLCIMFLLILSLKYFFSKKILNPKELKLKIWFLLGLLLFLGTIFVMMGPYTPIHKLLSIFFQKILIFPFPIYYRFVQCFAFAILTGIGTQWLLDSQFSKNPTRILIFYLLTIFFTGALILYFSEYTTKSVFDSSSINYIFSNKWLWFIKGPVLNFFIATFLLLSSAIFLKPDKFHKFLIILVTVEFLFMNYFVFYHNQEITNKPYLKQNLIFEQLYKTRFTSPSKHPLYQISPLLKKTTKKNMPRYIGLVSTLDNLAWVTGKYAALGNDSKPLIPKVKNILLKFSKGFPYEIFLNKIPVNFLKNTNVGYLMYQNFQSCSKKENIPYTINKNKQYVFKRRPLKKQNKILIDNINTHLHILKTKPLPYIYTQNKIYQLSDKKQLEKVIFSDLSNGVYVNKMYCQKKIGYSIKNFNQLQKINKISKINREKNNKLSFKAKINEPSIVVISEAWHPGWNIKINGEKKELLRVNYFQQGFWLNKGEYFIELNFFPPMFKIAGFIMLITIIILIFYTWKNENKLNILIK